jgi:hypothetical protein
MKTINQLLLSALALGLTTTAFAQGTAFTYQGRLNDGAAPATGRYDFRFKLYLDSVGNTQAGGSYLTNGIAVANGLFTTTVNFGAGVFAGLDYWMEVGVKTNGAGSYTVLTPLQALTPTPYAMFANSASNVLGVVPAAQLSGTVAEARIDAAVARNSGIMPIVLANDGAGSGLNADLLDGLHASSFASATHTHSGVQYLTIAGEGFVPGSNVDYFNSYGNGGAYIVSGGGALVAPVHLPNGAVVTEFRVYYYDSSTNNNLSVSLEREGFSSGYGALANVTTADAPGYGNGTDTTISYATIDNTTYSYLIYAYSASWDSNLRIKAVVIVYTVSTVP